MCFYKIHLCTNGLSASATFQGKRFYSWEYAFVYVSIRIFMVGGLIMAKGMRDVVNTCCVLDDEAEGQIQDAV
uniref:Transmembrane protein n=1 Tax=Steinernema glaseri TaxID=37863 RepID=A0A1I8AA69_9BILA